MMQFALLPDAGKPGETLPVSKMEMVEAWIEGVDDDGLRQKVRNGIAIHEDGSMADISSTHKKEERKRRRNKEAGTGRCRTSFQRTRRKKEEGGRKQALVVGIVGCGAEMLLVPHAAAPLPFLSPASGKPPGRNN